MASITERQTLATTTFERLVVVTNAYHTKLRCSLVDDIDLLCKIDLLLISIEVLLATDQTLEEQDFEKIESIIQDIQSYGTDPLFTFLKANL